jgi:hypothetical protein
MTNQALVLNVEVASHATATEAAQDAMKLCRFLGLHEITFTIKDSAGEHKFSCTATDAYRDDADGRTWELTTLIGWQPK